MFEGLALDDGAAGLIGMPESVAEAATSKGVHLLKEDIRIVEEAKEAFTGCSDNDYEASRYGTESGYHGASVVSRWPLVAIPVGRAVSSAREAAMEAEDAAAARRILAQTHRTNASDAGDEDEDETGDDDSCPVPLAGSSRIAVHCLRCAAIRGQKAVA